MRGGGRLVAAHPSADIVKDGGTRVRGGQDFILLVAVLSLLAVGTLVVFSASAPGALYALGTPYHFIERQIMWAALGIGLMVATSRIDYWRYDRGILPFFGLSVLLLIVVLVPHIGREINGSRRWLGFGPLIVQPSELAKLSMVMLFARLLSINQNRIGDFWRGVVPHLAIASVVFGLVIAEPDLGTTVALAGTFFVMLFVAGARTRHLLGLGTSALPILAAAIVAAPYRVQRVTTFLNPWKDPLGAGFHTIQGLLALGSGGILGVGLGASRQALGFLPEAYTDFAFAVLGEEMGLLGTISVVVLFLILAWRGYRIAMRAPDLFGSLLATGITTMIALQAGINIGVVTDTLPVTGITLPFISYGGSSLVLSLCGVGILLNISQHAT